MLCRCTGWPYMSGGQRRPRNPLDVAGLIAQWDLRKLGDTCQNKMQSGTRVCILAKSIRRLDDVMEGADEVKLGSGRQIRKKEKFHSGCPRERVHGVEWTLCTVYNSLWYFRCTYRFALDNFG